MRPLASRILARVAGAMLVVGALGQPAPAQQATKPDPLPPGYTRDMKGGLVPPKSGGDAVPDVPYLAPAIGTRETYTTFTIVITGSAGWRTTFVNENGRGGARAGLFLTDDPKGQLAYDPNVFKELWPLKVGRSLVMETQRFPVLWTWEFKVTGTERVTVRAGAFDTFIIESIEQPRIGGQKERPEARMTRFYYAPSINTIVRYTSQELSGPRRGQVGSTELVRLERPGKPAIGEAAAAPRSNKKK